MTPSSREDLDQSQDSEDQESQAVVRAGYRGLLEDIAEGEQQPGEAENDRLMGFMGNADSLFQQVSQCQSSWTHQCPGVGPPRGGAGREGDQAALETVQAASRATLGEYTAVLSNTGGGGDGGGGDDGGSGERWW